MHPASPQDAADTLPPEDLRAANIHPTTLLATDYLNHFNEAIMLLELIPSMPDCAADVMDWTPMSYEEHFARSHYRGKELVLKAYAHVPAEVKARFLAIIEAMDDIMTTAIARLHAATEEPVMAVIAAEAARMLKPLAARATGVMNAVADVEEDACRVAAPSAQDDIDALMAG